MLRLDLKRKGSNVYFKNLSLPFDDRRKLYPLNSLKIKGATEFKNIIRGGRRLSERPTVQEQPIEPTVVDRQSVTFDNSTFDDKGDDELRTIDADLKAAGEPPLES